MIMRNLLATLSTALFLSSVPAEASDVILRFEGTVTGATGSGLVGGPFTGALAGDAYELIVGLDTPGFGSFGTGEVLYNIDPETFRFEVGAAIIAAPASSNDACVVGNDVSFPASPSVDYIYGGTAVAPGQLVEFLVQDPSGQIFTTNELVQQEGVFVPGPGSGVSISTTGTLDGLDLRIDLMEIVARGPVEAAFCLGVAPNSTGAAGVLSAVGYDLARINDLALVGSSLPAGQTALLLVGRGSSAPIVLPGSQGVLCIGAPIGRFMGLVATADSAGRVVFDVDLGAIPSGPTFVPTVAGDTLYFQAWHRDQSPLGATSNLTSGASVTFR